MALAPARPELTFRWKPPAETAQTEQFTDAGEPITRAILDLMRLNSRYFPQKFLMILFSIASRQIDVIR